MYDVPGYSTVCMVMMYVCMYDMCMCNKYRDCCLLWLWSEWSESWRLGEHFLHLSDAVLESVMVFRGHGGRGGVVVTLGLAKAGFLSGCPVVLGIVAAS